MNKFFTALCLIIIAGICAFAQTTDEYNKNEFFVGYSNQQADRGGYSNFNGVEGSYVRNVNRYVGIKGDFSGAFRDDSLTNTFVTNTGSTTFRDDIKSSVYNILGGVQVKDNASKTRFKPFAHALAGVAVYRTKFNFASFGNSPGLNDSFTEKGFAAAVGGGLDIKINDRFDVRAIQADYNPIRFGNQWSNNFRFGIGIVIK